MTGRGWRAEEEDGAEVRDEIFPLQARSRGNTPFAALKQAQSGAFVPASERCRKRNTDFSHISKELKKPNKRRPRPSEHLLPISVETEIITLAQLISVPSANYETLRGKA